MTDWSKIKTLVVEDDPNMREVLVRLLRKKGSEVFEACDGQEAWTFLQAHTIDLVISDVQMPVMTGTELLQNIRLIDPKVPVFLLVTGQSALTEGESLQMGAAGLLHKPFKFNLLISRLEEILAAG